MRSRSMLAAAVAMTAVMLACTSPGGAPEATDTPSGDEIGTVVALTLTAQPASTEPPPSDTPVPGPTSTSTPEPDETAPVPLPASHTGIILQHGECYDLDTGNAPYVMGPACDMLFSPPYVIQMQNGAQISGYATLTPPSLSHCVGATYEPGDLSPNTDLYLCFRTNEGHYGFIVQRPDGAPFEISSTRLVFDYWVFEG